MAFPLYELFMETTPYPRSNSCGHERKGLRRSATYPDLRQARVNWRRYHIQAQPSIIHAQYPSHLQAQEKKTWSWIGTSITRKSARVSASLANCHPTL